MPFRRPRTPPLLTIALAVVAGAAAMPSESAARPFTTGIFDQVFYLPQFDDSSGQWLDRAKATGAGIVRIKVGWRNVATSRPSRPADPTDPAYKWGPTDDAVGDAASRGLPITLFLEEAPRWAEGPNRPRSAARGAWRPDPDALGQFMSAVAKRYSGQGGLPRVRFFQIWNEPNLSSRLAPQWTRRNGKLRPASPSHYRKMLNAGYRAVKRVRPDNFVISSGMAPFGDPPGGGRIGPALFVRELLCLSPSLKPKPCAKPAHLDALSQHLFSSKTPPAEKAVGREDVRIPDVAQKVRRPLTKAQRTGRVLPGGRKHVWVTELAWNSNPPVGSGVSPVRQARWLEEALYLLWRQRVSVVSWFRIVDARRGSSFSGAGLHFRDGRQKPAQRAFRFPFVTNRVSGRAVQAWGRAPAAGTVRIERKSGSGWRTITRLSTGDSRVFTGRVKLKRARKDHALRASIGGDRSLVWRQK